MAGYDQTSRRTVYDLTFDQYGGMLVSVRRPSELGWELIADAIDVLGEGLDSTAAPAVERIRAGGQLIRAFADALISWDLRDRGRAVPATHAGVLAQDRPFLLNVARTWYLSVALRPEEADQPIEQTAAPDPVEDETSDFEQRLMHLPVMTASALILDSPSGENLRDAELVGAR